MGVVIEMCVKYPGGRTRNRATDTVCNKRISLQFSEVHMDKRWQQGDRNRWP
jgi:hypothetical protein